MYHSACAMTTLPAAGPAAPQYPLYAALPLDRAGHLRWVFSCSSLALALLSTPWLASFSAPAAVSELHGRSWLTCGEACSSK